jgi:hypothetical protein
VGWVKEEGVAPSLLFEVCRKEQTQDISCQLTWFLTLCSPRHLSFHLKSQGYNERFGGSKLVTGQLYLLVSCPKPIQINLVFRDDLRTETPETLNQSQNELSH